MTLDQGKRPGRVATRVTNKKAIDKAEMYLRKNLPKYLKILEELARGVKVQRLTDDGETTYMVPPDRAALVYLLDRGMGKIPQRMEITGESGGPMQFLAWAGPEELARGEIIEGESKQID